QPLLDALNRCKVDADNNVSQQKQRDDAADAIGQYAKWYDALDDTQAAYPSARLFKVSKDSYSAANDWWSIETDKKMPSALFAGIMKRQEWAQGAYALN